jgi:hypothetical protein
MRGAGCLLSILAVIAVDAVVVFAVIRVLS